VRFCLKKQNKTKQKTPQKNQNKKQQIEKEREREREREAERKPTIFLKNYCFPKRRFKASNYTSAEKDYLKSVSCSPF
jgi:hypothetical protein